MFRWTFSPRGHPRSRIRLRFPDGRFSCTGSRTGAFRPLSLALLAWAAVALLALSAARAEVVAVLTPPAVWLEPAPDALWALQEDGTVVRVGDGGNRVAASGWTSDELWSCDGRVFGVDGRGRLASTDGFVGPFVAIHATPACLPGGGLAAVSADGTAVMRLTAELEVVVREDVAALPDTVIQHVPQPGLLRNEGSPSGVLALLAEPTFRYRHGALGDELEAGAVVILDAATLRPLDRFRVEPPAVIEQRTAIPFQSRGRSGLLVTTAADDAGAAVLALELESRGSDVSLRALGAGEPVGRDQRWLHAFAARGDRAYAVRTPHLGGPLERYRIRAGAIQAQRWDLGVTSHAFGSRNLQQAILLPLHDDMDRLVLPARSLRTLRLVTCSRECGVARDVRLSGRLNSNIAAVAAPGGSWARIFAADDGGAIHAFEWAIGDEGSPARAVR